VTLTAKSGLDLRSRSERSVADALLRLGPASKADLILATGLSRPTVQSALEGLTSDHLVVLNAEVARRPGTSGRPPQLYRLTPAAGIAVGVEIGRRHIQVVVADGGHRQLASIPPEQLRANADAEPLAVLAQVASLVRRAHAAAGTRLPLLGVGLGIPLPITTDGRIGTATLIPSWAEIDVGAQLGAHLGELPVHVANDASLGALGEHTFGAGRGTNELIYVKLGWGIGAGMIIGGRSHRGAAGTAGELGHITVKPGGAPCPCGSTGCLELYAGGKALLQQAAAAGVNVEVVPDLVRLALAGNPTCRRIVEEAAMTIGHALATVVNLTSPALILLGGSLSAANNVLRAPLELGLNHSGMQTAVAATSIQFSRLGPLASAWGAVALVIDQNVGSTLRPRATSTQGHALRRSG